MFLVRPPIAVRVNHPRQVFKSHNDGFTMFHYIDLAKPRTNTWHLMLNIDLSHTSDKHVFVIF